MNVIGDLIICDTLDRLQEMREKCEDKVQKAQESKTEEGKNEDDDESLSSINAEDKRNLDIIDDVVQEQVPKSLIKASWDFNRVETYTKYCLQGYYARYNWLLVPKLERRSYARTIRRCITQVADSFLNQLISQRVEQTRIQSQSVQWIEDITKIEDLHERVAAYKKLYENNAQCLEQLAAIIYAIPDKKNRDQKLRVPEHPKNDPFSIDKVDDVLFYNRVDVHFRKLAWKLTGKGQPWRKFTKLRLVMTSTTKSSTSTSATTTSTKKKSKKSLVATVESNPYLNSWSKRVEKLRTDSPNKLYALTHAKFFDQIIPTQNSADDASHSKKTTEVSETSDRSYLSNHRLLINKNQNTNLSTIDSQQSQQSNPVIDSPVFIGSPGSSTATTPAVSTIVPTKTFNTNHPSASSMTTSTKDDNCMINTDLFQQEENVSEIIRTFRPVLGQFINENLDVAMEALIDAWNKRPKKPQVTKGSTDTTVSNQIKNGFIFRFQM
jgi:hypothetical protein